MTSLREDVAIWDDPALSARFWAKVSKGDGCWEWTGYTNPYGSLTVNGRSARAHRIAWALHNKQDPGNKLVCHHCDNPPCVNPSHLFLGTHLDNARDMVAKGRHVRPARDESKVNHPRGERAGAAKLNADQVLVIRGRIAAGEMHKDIANDYGVHRSLIGKILSRDVWAHI